MKKILMLLLGILLAGVILFSSLVSALNVTQQVTVTVLAGEFNVLSPKNGDIFSDKRVEINIVSLGGEADYMKYSDNDGAIRTLCRNCDSYDRRKTFRDGFHELKIFGLFGIGEIDYNINFTVDSTKPRISRTEPKRNSVINGSEFYIKYTEDNLQNITLFYGTNQTTKYNCTAGRNQECIFSEVDLTGYKNQWIEYYFEVTDVARTVQSKKTRVLVDTTSPILTVNMPKDTDINETYGRKVPFNMTVTEDVLLEYIDNSDVKPRWRRLTSNNDEYGSIRTKIKSFKRGLHNIQIRATDKAGNSDIKKINFEVEY